MDDKENNMPLEDQIGEDDWALIIGNDGNLKGMFIPEGKEENQVPYSIIHIMEKYFGLNLTEEDEDDEQPTVYH